MKNTALAHTQTIAQRLITPGADKVHRQRLQRFARWLAARDGNLYTPDLAAWRDALLAEGLRRSSVRAYLSTVRSRYRDLLRDNATRDELYTRAGDLLTRMGQEDTPANRFALVNERLTRLHNALDPAHARVNVPTRQDHTDRQHLRLTKEQAETLLDAPGTDTLMGLRDTALIALMLCTGLREGELVQLQVSDLRQRAEGELALLIREGKGGKTRLVPYGSLSWVIVLVEKWLAVAGIPEGPIFRSLRKGGHVQDGALTTRAVQQILARYPLVIDGQRRTVRPHDLRRTYAARQYAAGMDLNALRQNLGHADVKTTLGYIGDMAMDTRRGQPVYTFDLHRLDNLTV
jgi:site-specific recombinase XerD